jgi:NADH dehydrogenase [ubiquinone] 1 alpha subcomplex assembly factor 6
MFHFRRIKSVHVSRIFCKYNSHEACVNLVKTHDYENYFIGLIFPRLHRQNFYTIHAFNTEMALVKYSVRGNATAGRVRYKWWNDYIAQLYTDAPKDNASDQHPVADSVRNLLYQKPVSRRWFESLIEARTRELLPPQLHTLSDMEDSVEKTHSSILYLILEAMELIDGNSSEDAVASPLMHMASHVGVAFGLVCMLRGVAHDLSKVCPVTALDDRRYAYICGADLSGCLLCVVWCGVVWCGG